jgi:hypothetical protein
MTHHPRVPPCAHAENEPGAPELEVPIADDDWQDFDPTPLEACILDDFEWEIEEAYPQRGDYWDETSDEMRNDE